MSPRTRVAAVVALVAGASAAVVVAVVAHSGGPTGQAASPRPRSGAPPLALDLGVRGDAEARDLRRALGLYDAGRRKQAGAVFARHRSLEAQVGQAVAAWPDGTVIALARLGGLYPRSALVQLNLGLALFWAGRGGAEQAWRQAASLEPDTSYAVTAGNLLFPRYARNLPVFVPAESAPAALNRNPPARQLAILRHDARSGPASAKLLYGVALQRLGHQLSARRQFDEAVRAAPNDAEAQVAAAVARFDKTAPSAAFARLGPLGRRYPHAATVRFHLGLLLLWMGSVREAERELRLATRVEPSSPLAREAARYLDRLQSAGVR